MVKLIVGEKGKGKTKELLEKVNSEIKKASGNIVYIDKSSAHMYELNNKVRLIDVSEYLVQDYSEFLGFVSGIISQDHDLEQMYFDGILALAKTDISKLDVLIEKLEALGNKFAVDFIASVSADEKALSASAKEKILISL